MESTMRTLPPKRASILRTAPCATARRLVSNSPVVRSDPVGPDRIIITPSPTRKHLLARQSLVFALLAALAILVPPPPAWAAPSNPHGVALIIGNTDYEHRDVPDVTFAHRDADAFRRYVVDVLGYHPRNIVDLRDATRRELFDALGTKSDPRSLLWSYLDPDGASEVVVFYSGHGVPGVNDKRGYLLPVDADPKAAEDDGYPIDLLYRNVGGLAEARSVRVYLDACFSGGSGGGGTLIRDASPVFVEATLPEGLDEKVTSLAAATGKQVASWDEEAKHGLFTHHLLDALYGKADADGDGKVTAREVKGYLDRYMTRAARRQHRRIQQASLVGAAEVVVASAGAGGAFPGRPGLGDTERRRGRGAGDGRGERGTGAGRCGGGRRAGADGGATGIDACGQEAGAGGPVGGGAGRGSGGRAVRPAHRGGDSCVSEEEGPAGDGQADTRAGRGADGPGQESAGGDGASRDNERREDAAEVGPLVNCAGKRNALVGLGTAG